MNPEMQDPTARPGEKGQEVDPEVYNQIIKQFGELPTMGMAQRNDPTGYSWEKAKKEFEKDPNYNRMMAESELNGRMGRIGNPNKWTDVITEDQFDTADTDKDGFISPVEIVDFAKQAKSPEHAHNDDAAVKDLRNLAKNVTRQEKIAGRGKKDGSNSNFISRDDLKEEIKYQADQDNKVRMSNAKQAIEEGATYLTTNFQSLDKDKDGFLTKSQIDDLIGDSKIPLSDRATLLAVSRNFDSLAARGDKQKAGAIHVSALKNLGNYTPVNYNWGYAYLGK